MRRKTHDCQTCIALLPELKKKKKKNVTESENYENKATV